MARRIQVVGPYTLEPKLRRETDAIYERRPPSYSYPDGYGVQSDGRIVGVVVKRRMAWVVHPAGPFSETILGGGSRRIAGYVANPKRDLATGKTAKDAVEALAVARGQMAKRGDPPVQVVETFLKGETQERFRGGGPQAHWRAKEKLEMLVAALPAEAGGSIAWKQLEAGKPLRVVASYQPELQFDSDGYQSRVWKASTRKVAGLPFRGPKPRRAKAPAITPKPRRSPAKKSEPFVPMAPRRHGLAETPPPRRAPAPLGVMRSGPLTPLNRRVFVRTYGLTPELGELATPAIIEAIYEWRTTRGLDAKDPQTRSHLLALLGRPEKTKPPKRKPKPAASAAAKKAPPMALPRARPTDPLLKIRLKPESAKRQARRLARSRELALRRMDREKLQRIRAELKVAQKRQREALRAAVRLCRRARVKVREQIKVYRAAERDRINAEVAELRAKTRAACAARKARIRAAGGSVRERRRRELAEERKLQRQLASYGKAARARHAKTTGRERIQESDDAVRSNLPPELVPVFDKVRASIKAGPRRTRTEAFLEWAAANPGDVMAIQTADVDRDVKRLVAQREALERRLAKTKAYGVSPEDMRTLERMGLAPNQQKAQKLASGLDWVPF